MLISVIQIAFFHLFFAIKTANVLARNQPFFGLFCIIWVFVADTDLIENPNF